MLKQELKSDDNVWLAKNEDSRNIFIYFRQIKITVEKNKNI